MKLIMPDIMLSFTIPQGSVIESLTESVPMSPICKLYLNTHNFREEALRYGTFRGGFCKVEGKKPFFFENIAPAVSSLAQSVGRQVRIGTALDILTYMQADCSHPELFIPSINVVRSRILNWHHSGDRRELDLVGQERCFSHRFEIFIIEPI